MEKVLTVSTYDIPSVVNRWVDLDLPRYDESKPIFAQIILPTGFEGAILTAKSMKNGPAVAIHKRVGGKVLHPVTRVKLKVYQIVDEAIPVEDEPVKQKEKVKLNPDPATEKEPKKGIFSSGIRPKDWKTHSVERAQARKRKLARIKAEVDESKALKPAGLDGKTIMTCDDVDYARGIAVIENLIQIEKSNNLKEGNTSPSQRKMMFEYCDVFSFSGISSVIGLYLALGAKTKGKGNLNYLMDWYQNELSEIFSPTSFGEIVKKGKLFANGLKPKKFRTPPNPGFSIKQAEKIISEFFKKEFTGEDLRMEDLEKEVYQPVFFDDEQSRVYSKAETPNARIVDVILDTGLNPLYFQSRKILVNGEEKLSLGPVRKSFDLPVAQYNEGITLISIGADPGYQETEKNFSGMNPAQIAFLNKRKSYRIDNLDVKKYMDDHKRSVSYLRVVSGPLNGVMPNSISHKDFEACKRSARERTVVTSNIEHWQSNGRMPVIEWSLS